MTESLEDQIDRSFVAGERMAWASMLSECVRRLGYDSKEGAADRWIIEREATVNALRDVCADFGDNNWEPNLHLADVVQKHLGRHLHDAKADLDD